MFKEENSLKLTLETYILFYHEFDHTHGASGHEPQAAYGEPIRIGEDLELVITRTESCQCSPLPVMPVTYNADGNSELLIQPPAEPEYETAPVAPIPTDDSNNVQDDSEVLPVPSNDEAYNGQTRARIRLAVDQPDRGQASSRRPR